MKCYLCKSSARVFIRKLGYTIYRCPSCGLGMTDLKEDYGEFLNQFYTEGYYTGDPHYGAYVHYRNDKPNTMRNMKKILKKIQMQKSNSTLLDVGCAYGFFIDLALANGFDAYGFDASSYAIREAKTLVGDRAKLGTVQSVTYGKRSFDVISLLDVFEHLSDPVKDLRKLRSVLKDDGIIVIATGDSDSFMARLLKRRWTFYVPPQHLFFYNRSTLTRFLTSVGLAPIAWHRVGKWLSLAYVFHLARTTGESKLAQSLYPFIRKTRLGTLPLYLPVKDNMVVIAKKMRQ